MVKLIKRDYISLSSSTQTPSFNWKQNVTDSSGADPLACPDCGNEIGGQGRIRTSVAIQQRVYSPSHLTTLEPALLKAGGGN